MSTPLEKLKGDWGTHYSDMPFETFVSKVHGKFYSDIPFGQFTDKIGLTTAPELNLAKTPPSPATSGFIGGDIPLAEHTPQESQENARLLAEGAVAAPLYTIPYAGPGLAGGAATIAGRAVDRLHGTPSEQPFAAELAKNVAAGYLFKGAEKVGGKALRAIVPRELEARIADTVKKGIQKGIRPSVAGKANAPQTQAYFKKAQDAVESIIEHKPNLQFLDEAGEVVKGKLPGNLNQFSSAVDQTKKAVFQKYDAIIRSESAEGLTVALDDIAGELSKFGGAKVNRLFGGGPHGGSASYADGLAEKFSGQQLSLTEAQEAIAVLNSRLNAFYKNPTVETASNAAVDAMVANRLRQAVDAAVEGSGYQALKNQYGALREIEKEVSHRAMVDARKNIKGLIDFADIATATEAARAIATMSPGSGAAAFALGTVKKYYKHLNNPNRIVKQMFKDAEKLVGKRTIATLP